MWDKLELRLEKKTFKTTFYDSSNKGGNSLLEKRVHQYLPVITAVFLSHSISAEGVVVKARIFHQRHPLLPSRGHVGAIVLIQILSKKGWVGKMQAICCGFHNPFVSGKLKKHMLGLAELTCPVARVVEVHSKGVRLVVHLPRGRGAVLVVCVSVVVVHILPRQDGGAGRAAHGCGWESV